ncbi:hypothetical protein VCRA219O19_10073 [Vibrio crassostreae]|nr:hypothetical protein VCRA219O19_10073 [Vibrio crassostreae]
MIVSTATVDSVIIEYFIVTLLTSIDLFIQLSVGMNEFISIDRYQLKHK